MYKYNDFDEAFIRSRNAQFRHQVERRIDGTTPFRLRLTNQQPCFFVFGLSPKLQDTEFASELLPE